MEFSAGPAEGRSRGGRRESGGGVWVRRRGAPGVPAKDPGVPEKATGVKKSPAGRKKPTQKVTSPAPFLIEGFVLRSFLEFGSSRNSLLRFAFFE